MNKSILISELVDTELNARRKPGESYDSLLRDMLGLPPKLSARVKTIDHPDYLAVLALEPGQETMIPFVFDQDDVSSGATNARHIQAVIRKVVESTGRRFYQSATVKGVSVYRRKDDGLPSPGRPRLT